MEGAYFKTRAPAGVHVTFSLTSFPGMHACWHVVVRDMKQHRRHVHGFGVFFSDSYIHIEIRLQSQPTLDDLYDVI